MDTQDNAPSAQALTYGFEELQVKDRKGEAYTVKVRAVLNRELQQYVELLLADEAPLAEFLTGKKREFIDQLDDDSIYAINDAGERINNPRLARWEERQTRRAERLKPFLEERLANIKASSPISSPTTAASTGAGG